MYLVYVPSTKKVTSSYDVVPVENISSTLAYTSRPYSEAMAMCLAVTLTPYATSSKEKNVDTTTLKQFEEGDLLSEISVNAESCDKSDDKSIMPPLISKE